MWAVEESIEEASTLAAFHQFKELSTDRDWKKHSTFKGISIYDFAIAVQMVYPLKLCFGLPLTVGAGYVCEFYKYLSEMITGIW